jgi:hypothetical protein
MLSLALFGTVENSLRIRQDVVRRVVAYYNVYSPSNHFEHLGFSETPTPQQYETCMSHPFNYGDFVEITASSALFQWRIVAYVMAVLSVT